MLGDFSSDSAADALMEEIAPGTGPLAVTADMNDLGFKDVFMGAYYHSGGSLFQRFTTPANSRIDISADPDIFNQTTPSETGELLLDIYQCATEGGGALVAIWPDKFNATVCQEMIQDLSQDNLAVLIQGGLPEGTKIAHKHGWIVDSDGLVHNVSDAAIVYSPGGNYILSIYLHHPVQLVYERFNPAIAEMSKAVYNFFNLPTQ
jgi:hypothetical protein